MDANGNHVRQVFRKSARRSEPTWSPEGDKIVYTEEVVDRDLQIVVVNVETGRKKQLTHRGLNIIPSWFNPVFTTLPVMPQPELLTTVWGKIKVD